MSQSRPWTWMRKISSRTLSGRAGRPRAGSEAATVASRVTSAGGSQVVVGLVVVSGIVVLSGKVETVGDCGVPEGGDGREHARRQVLLRLLVAVDAGLEHG